MFKVFRVCVPFYDSDEKRDGCRIFIYCLTMLRGCDILKGFPDFPGIFIY